MVLRMNISLIFQALYTPTYVPVEIDSFDVPINRMTTGQLQTMVFRSFPITENEIAIIWLILACSLFLKNIYIVDCNLTADENENMRLNWDLARRLLKLPRASPTAGVDFLY